MLVLSVQLTVLSLADADLPLAHGAGRRVRRELATSTQKSMADMTAITEETLSVSGVLLTKTFGRQATRSDASTRRTSDSRDSRSARR